MCDMVKLNLISVKNVKIVCYLKGSLTLKLRITFFLSKRDRKMGPLQRPVASDHLTFEML